MISKLIYLLVIAFSLSTIAYLFQFETTKVELENSPIQNCGQINKPWKGFTSIIKSNDLVCFYTNDFNPMSSTNDTIDLFGQSKQILGNAMCPKKQSVTNGFCKYNNGYYEVSAINGQSEKLQGQAQDTIISTVNYENDKDQLQATFQSSIDLSNPDFSRAFTDVFDVINDNKGYKQTCDNLSGTWYLRYLVQDDKNVSNCLYDLEVNMQTTVNLIEFDGKVQNSNYSGKGDVQNACQLSIYSFLADCNTPTQNITNLYGYKGYFFENLIIIQNKGEVLTLIRKI